MSSPWAYKFLIVVVLLGGMAIIGATLAIGMATRDVQVVENAYEEGLNYDRTRKRADELGWKVEMSRDLQQGAEGLDMTVRDRSGAGVPNARVTLRAFLQGGRELQTCDCLNEGNGRYRAPVRLNTPGSWTALVRVAVKEDIQSFENAVRVLPGIR